MLQDLAVRDLKSAVFDALVRGDNVLWLKGDNELYGKDRNEISNVKIATEYISEELAFIKFLIKNKRKGNLIKKMNAMSMDEYYQTINEVNGLAKQLTISPKDLEAFPAKNDISLETLYTIPRGKWVTTYLNKGFTGLFNKIFIVSEVPRCEGYEFEVAFKRGKTTYFAGNQFLVKEFLKLPLNKTYSVYMDGCMAFSEGGFQKKSDRKLIYLYSIYQLD
jgi:hypothetical protein